jgi:hypothetical protein
MLRGCTECLAVDHKFENGSGSSTKVKSHACIVIGDKANTSRP